MRLIDADAFKEYIRVACEEMSHVYKDGGKWAKQITEDFCIDIDEQPTIEERKTGKWVEKHHAYADEEKVIEEWQSCKCSVCGRYDTRPYLYYFDEPHFCSWCGARMVQEGEDK